MTDSPPSRLKRFWPTNFVCRNVSNASAWLSLRRMRSCSSDVGFEYVFSSLFCIQARSSGFWMCMYSTPTVRQYESRRMPRILRSLRKLAPPKPPVANVRSRSHSVRPWLVTSRSG